MFNEQGPELGKVTSSGVQIFSHPESKNMLQSAFNNGAAFNMPAIHVHNHNNVTNIIDGHEMTDHIGRHRIKTVYKTGPVKSGV